ncbi:hypothetical protein ASPVEDRAFT_34217 [Aspergillus versicolor CBS 583.65]|uniref:Uncharacterized protein n=1 Tax=Aspergillus versicolor CBS 583.65 TaxID=1036611 RepID=A0A1L9Q2V8_ASPVE|nr:uncharacterized protein ASPVEDRAFT_34217 [Aspergillus versicolor CBS 583.65]OJJ08042.1 hypothetical protein ASPVEDRAFT_34217 [Aspergillus versicolor CBS 583.65]
MVTSDTVCAALDHGGGVRFGSQTFAIYSCAPLPPGFEHLKQNVALHTKLKASVSRVCRTLPIYVNLDDPEIAQLASLPVLLSPTQPSASTIYQLPWFLINAATFTQHCVIGRGSAVESLLVILQRPWCVLEVCCTDIETVAAVREFALLAAQADPDSYSAAVLLLSHEYRARISPVLTDIFHSVDPCVSRCSERALCDVYAATTLVHSYNRFWLPLVCSCAVYLDISFSEVVRRIRDDSGDGSDCRGWISLYRGLLGRIGDWVT